MPILKYKLNGQWIALSGGAETGGGGTVAVDPTLSIEGMAADARATGEAIVAMGEVVGNAVTAEQLAEAIAPIGEYLVQLEEQIAEKQSKVYLSTSKPAGWQDGDIWLKPAE